MININTEQMLTLGKATAEVPGHPHVSTLIRWAMRGARGIKLESIKVGGRRYTSVEAINRFLARLNPPGSVANSNLAEIRQRQLSQTNSKLDEEGF
jgi:Protein of unknown function (DUF1580)